MEGACDAAGVLQAHHLYGAAVGEGRHQRSEVGLQDKPASVAAAMVCKSATVGDLTRLVRQQSVRDSLGGHKHFGAKAQGWRDAWRMHAPGMGLSA